MTTASTEIDALRAEVERLRAALTNLFQACSKLCLDDMNALEPEILAAQKALTPPDTQRTLPPTPPLTQYQHDIILLSAGHITEAEFCERQGRKPL
jgi:hypothetical protein